MKNSFNIAQLASSKASFDLQFRKDTRRERINSPTYYRWKAQFIMTESKENAKVIKKVKREIKCGKIHTIKNQVRFSVQNINDIVSIVVPFFKKNRLSGNKQRDFELWQRAVNIIYENKGKYILEWEKNDLRSLIQIHQTATKYKNNPREPKWIEMARLMVKTI